MIKRITLSISIFLTLAFLAFPVIAHSTTYYVASTGSNTFPYNTWAKAATSIQTAIDAASNDDIIIIGSSDGHGAGFYTENVTVNKQLTIQSENGFSTTTVVAASSNDHVFDVQANNVTIGGTGHGFSIYGATGGGAGIYLTSINNCTIENNRIGWDSTYKNSVGIYLESSDTATISENIINYNNAEGIWLSSSNNNNLTSNEVNNNNSDGIVFHSSLSNSLSYNTASNNAWDAIVLDASSNNTLENNITIDNGTSGFRIVNSSNNILANNTANRNGANLAVPGISLSSSSNNTLTGNTSNYNKEGIGLVTSSGNDLTHNSVSHNEFGIYLFESSNNTITSNTMNDNDGRWDGDGIMLNDNCSNNIIANNTMSNDPGDGIELYNASNNILSGNTITNSGVNVRINHYSASNTLVRNTITLGSKGIAFEEEHSINNIVANNIIDSNFEDGILLFDNTSTNTIIGNTLSNNGNGINLAQSNNNIFYLNNLINNTRNSVESNSSTNTWYSPTTIYYNYNGGAFHTGYLGNYYSDGTHTGDYGIGGTYTIANDNNDDYQLINNSGNYSLQAWWLDSDNKMYINDVSKPGGSVTINAGDSNIWIADQAVANNTRFSGSDTWTGQLVFVSAPTSAHSLTIEIGSSTNGSDFTAGGPDATLIGDGSNLAFTYATDTSAFNVTAGNYLALKITSIDAAYSLFTGGAWSFTTGVPTVTFVNDPPVAGDLTEVTNEDEQVNVTLTGTDGDADPLTFRIASDPSNGSVALAGAVAAYSPNPDFNGTDSFTYVANDGVVDSNPATVTITVTPVDDPPTAPVVLVPAPGSTIQVSGQPTARIGFGWTESVDPEGQPISYTWSLGSSADLISVLWSVSTEATSVDTTVAALASLLNGLGVAPGGQQELFQSVTASDGAIETHSQITNIDFRRGTVVGTQPDLTLPSELELESTYPNPASDLVNLRYGLARSKTVTISLFDILGRAVIQLPTVHEVVGYHSLQLDLSGLTSGVYYIRLDSDVGAVIGRLVVRR